MAAVTSCENTLYVYVTKIALSNGHKLNSLGEKGCHSYAKKNFFLHCKSSDENW